MQNLNDIMTDYEITKGSLVKTVINPARKNPKIKQYKDNGLDIFEDLTGKLILNENGIVEYTKK